MIPRSISFLLLFFQWPVHAVAPYTVKEFKSLKLTEVKRLQVRGYARPGFECPPCPKEALCGPCPPDFFILSDTEKVGGEEIQVPYDRNIVKPIQWPSGTLLTVTVEFLPKYEVSEVETPADRERRKKSFEENQRLGKELKKSLDDNPKLRKTKRPGWLQDVPGNSYDLQK